jgi:hypothetical protein
MERRARKAGASCSPSLSGRESRASRTGACSAGRFNAPGRRSVPGRPWSGLWSGQCLRAEKGARQSRGGPKEGKKGGRGENDGARHDRHKLVVCPVERRVRRVVVSAARPRWGRCSLAYPRSSRSTTPLVDAHENWNSMERTAIYPASAAPGRPAPPGAAGRLRAATSRGTQRSGRPGDARPAQPTSGSAPGGGGARAAGEIAESQAGPGVFRSIRSRSSVRSPPAPDRGALALAFAGLIIAAAR